MIDWASSEIRWAWIGFALVVWMVGFGVTPAEAIAVGVSVSGEGMKRLNHQLLGPVTFEYSHFAVDGRPDLGMVVYNPVSDDDADRIRAHIAAHHAPR
jgi:hypothetical protein